MIISILKVSTKAKVAVDDNTFYPNISDLDIRYNSGDTVSLSFLYGNTQYNYANVPIANVTI